VWVNKLKHSNSSI
jgi:hypothetical protein